MKNPLICCLAAHLTMATLANAQEKDPWIGQRVFTQYGAVMKVGNDIVDDEGRSRSLAVSGHDRAEERLYRVEHVNGDWLWLKDEKSSKAGWVDRRWVVPYDQAVEFYTARIRANPQASTYIARGNIWSEKGEHDIAIADYGEAIRLDPKEASAYYNRGIAWSAKKDYEKAIADYGEAIRLDPKDARAYNNRGNAWQLQRDYEKAIADYGEAIRLDPKDAMAYHKRAWLWATCPDEKHRDGKRAVESATRACELSEWKDANDLDTLAAAYAESGDFAKAVEWQEKAHKLYSDEDKKKWGKLLDLYRDKKPYRDTD